MRKYFSDNNLDPKNPWNGLWRMILVVGVCLTCWYYLWHPNATDVTVTFTLPQTMTLPPVLQQCLNYIVDYSTNPTSTSTNTNTLTILHTITVPLVTSNVYKLLLGIVFGICQALPLLHIMHDCSHCAWGHNEYWWYFGKYICVCMCIRVRCL